MKLTPVQKIMLVKMYEDSIRDKHDFRNRYRPQNENTFFSLVRLGFVKSTSSEGVRQTLISGTLTDKGLQCIQEERLLEADLTTVKHLPLEKLAERISKQPVTHAELLRTYLAHQYGGKFQPEGNTANSFKDQGLYLAGKLTERGLELCDMLYTSVIQEVLAIVDKLSLNEKMEALKNFKGISHWEYDSPEQHIAKSYMLSLPEVKNLRELIHLEDELKRIDSMVLSTEIRAKLLEFRDTIHFEIEKVKN